MTDAAQFRRNALLVTLLGFAIGLTGCQSVPQVYRFPELGFDVAVMSPADQKRACAPKVETTWDDGSPRPAGLAGAGMACFDRIQRLIVLAWGASAETLIHELCHAAGRPDKECGEI